MNIALGQSALLLALLGAVAGAVTLIGSAFGALYPGLSAARHDTIEALAYE